MAKKWKEGGCEITVSKMPHQIADDGHILMYLPEYYTMFLLSEVDDPTIICDPVILAKDLEDCRGELQKVIEKFNEYYDSQWLMYLEAKYGFDDE